MKMRKRKRIRMVGLVQRRDTGRPEVVYGRRCPQDELEHEVRVADLELILKTKIIRGVKVGRTEPDGMTIRGGQRCFIEIDNSGKMTVKKQMEAKWKRYENVDGFILVVAVTEARMQRIRKGAERVKELAFFTTCERLRTMAQPWIDWHGNSLTI